MKGGILNLNKIWKRLVALFIIFFCIYEICRGLNYLYVDDSTNDWDRVMWHNFYMEDENIDNLYLGSSHVFFSINPFLLDDLNGENNFNLATSGQRLNGSYYLLKEADKEHNLKHVYLEMYYALSTGDKGDYSAPDNLNDACWRNTDYMKWSLNKLAYMLTECKTENYAETFFPFVRFRNKLFDMSYVKSQMERKSTNEYRNYGNEKDVSIDGKVSQYKDKGYYYSEIELSPRYLAMGEYIIKEKPLSEDAEKALRRIIEYCKQENIALTLYSSPVHELRVLCVEDYDFYVNQIKSIADEYDIEYYDFNLCKEEYLPLQGTKYFIDTSHLNADGAMLFTDLFYRVLQNTDEENNKIFYSSYNEKKQKAEEQICGIIKLESISADGRITYWKVASYRSEGIKYKIFVTPYEGQTVMLRDFSENQYFTLPKDEHGVCTIIAQMVEHEEEQVLEVEY